jgi:regulator of telomere elongation helicase 1
LLLLNDSYLLQESICAEAASFDLPSWLLTACISEAQNCVDLLIGRRNKSNDTSQNPDDFSILKGELNFTKC